ncbi:hypothetical protein KBG31_01585 [Patescibacteria group bacterium]|nr:hypothetical protein [Patescibacteria group bacterium]
MPIIAAHIGLGSNSFLILDGVDDLFLYNYPYSYDSINFSHFCTPQKFYKELFELVAKNHSLNLQESEILIVSRMPEEYFSDLNLAHYCHSSDLDLHQDDATTIYLRRTLENSDIFKNSLDLPKDTSLDVLSNMYLYDNIIPASLEDNVVWGHKIISSKIFSSKKKEAEKNILFTGPALTGTLLSKFFKYSLAFSVVSELGLFSASLDDRDLHYVVSLIKQFEPDIYSNIRSKICYEYAGKIMKCRGKIECLVKKEYTEQQDFYQIDEEDLFVYPLEEGEKAHIFIKGNSCRPAEFDIEGGDLGFVIDTRTDAFWQVRQENLVQKYANWIRRISFVKG